MKYLKSLLVIFILAFYSLSQASAYDQLNIKADPSKKIVKKGEKFEIKLTLTFKDHWYTYGMKEVIGPDGLGPMPTEVTVSPNDLVEIKGKVREPKPQTKHDKAFDIEILYHKGKVVFTIPVIAKKDMEFPKSKISATAVMQLCDAERCLPPEEYTAQVSGNSYAEEAPAEIDTVSQDSGSENVPVLEDAKKEMAANDVAPEPENIKKSGPEKTEIEQKQDEGILSFLWFSMTAGALALLTPCVFPMVPITVSFFTRRAEKSKGKGLRDALVYAFGIIFTFTALGFLFSLIFGASGIQDFTSSPWVNFVISLIFIMFAFNLFGAFELQIPSSITNKLNAKSMEGEGLMSVILMGLTFSLASFSCTGPLVAAALVSAASGNWFYPIISMLGFSTVLAAPFFLLALFPTALTSLPRAGGWMNNIKVVLGLIVIAATMKFLNNAFYDWGFGFSREIFLSIWIACSALATIYILGFFRMSHDSPVESVGSVRLMFALTFATFTFYLITGFSGKPMGTLEAYLPAPEEIAISSIAPSGSTQLLDKWYDNLEEAKAAALEQNKPIFLDFTGKHCPNCRLMERTIFTQPEVAERLSRMIKVKLITDLREEPYISNKQYQLNNYQSVAIPFYVIISPDGNIIDRVGYTPDKDDYVNFLDKAFNK